jgi:hypothetical protein
MSKSVRLERAMNRLLAAEQFIADPHGVRVVRFVWVTGSMQRKDRDQLLEAKLADALGEIQRKPDLDAVPNPPGV